MGLLSFSVYRYSFRGGIYVSVLQVGEDSFRGGTDL